LARALDRDFGSVAAWHAEFTATAKALAGDSGWAILAWSERVGRLVNQWGADHAHNLPGATPILALDMYKHAYHLDFGAKAAAYVDQAMANLNWARIGARYRLAIGEGVDEHDLFLPYGAPAQEDGRISAEELRAALGGDKHRRPVLLDVCLPQDLARRTDMLAGAGSLGWGFAALPADRGLLHLRVSDQWHGRAGTPAAGLRCQISRWRDYRVACDRRRDRAAGYVHL
jgi:Fe-Mn family superoxide dismutase